MIRLSDDIIGKVGNLRPGPSITRVVGVVALTTFQSQSTIQIDKFNMKTGVKFPFVL